MIVLLNMKFQVCVALILIAAALAQALVIQVGQ